MDRQYEDLDTSKLFRMPWTSTDNAFSWLEITRRCNLNCDYCYQKNLPDSDKRLADVASDLQTFARLRKADTLFISGGEPLLHPRLEAIVEMVRPYGLKPVLVTNGHILTPDRVRRLKKVGLAGFVFHVDRGQSRPGWCDKSEKELNLLRQQYADMAHAENMICAFNTTILPETLHEVPAIVEWTIRNIHKVCTNSLIPVRVPSEKDPWDLYVGDTRIGYQDTVFPSRKYKNPSGTQLFARDIYAQIQKVIPEFQANAFLGGTDVPEAPKWLFCNVIGTPQRIFGAMGPKAMEILQNGHHFLKGRFLSFLKPGFYARAQLLLPLAVLDRALRKTFLAWLGAALTTPLLPLKKLSIQSILVLQPQDVLPSGKQDLCDGCPNKTVHDGRLVSMCRVEEFISFGDMVTLRRKGMEAGAACGAGA